MKLFNRKYLSTIATIVIAISFSNFGCKKFIAVEAPITSTNGSNVYTNDATAAAVLTGIYTTMIQASPSGGGITSLSVYPGLSSDELTLFNYASQNTTYQAYFTNTLTNNNTGSPDYWNNFYTIIFFANSAIEGLTASTTLTPSIKQQLLGEAKFVRAFCYFYLANLYGDVPLVIGTDYNANRLLTRTPKVQIYNQIITDLKEAQDFLIDGYVARDIIKSTVDRISPNKWAATALLARTYLYNQQYSDAEIQATAVINNTSLYSLVPLNNVFLKNSNEAIWQLQPVAAGVNSWDAILFILPTTGPNANGTFPVYLNTNLISSFEFGDNRKSNWTNNVTIGSVTYYYAYKYKINTLNASVSEYPTVLRLGEQYLIRAEASAQGGSRGLSGAIADLNTIRIRAGLAATTATTSTSVLTAIQHERQVELFTEWGHRWLDLKRTGAIDAVMNTVSLQKNGMAWKSSWQLYPIPLLELQRDPNLVQNNGY